MMLMMLIRRLFIVTVITTSLWICISLVVLFRHSTTVKINYETMCRSLGCGQKLSISLTREQPTVHGFQQQPHEHSFKDLQVANQDDIIAVNAKGHLVNPHPYSFTINTPDLCRDLNDSAEGPLVLAYVQTAPANFERRNRVRRTWGRRDNYHRVRLRTIFVLGLGHSSQLQAQIETEAQRFGDIVQEDFIDSYRNLTYKGVAALKWISRHCREATYVVKVDDDTFANMFTIVKHLKDLYTTAQRSRIIMCSVWWSGRVYRRGKWGVTKKTVPWSVYPPYCSGLFVIMSADVAQAAYRASYHVPFFWIDDVYFTGHLIQALNRLTSDKNRKMKNIKSVDESRDVVKGGYNVVGVSSGSKLSLARPIVHVGGASGVGGLKGVAKGGVVGGEVKGEPIIRHVDISVALCNQTEMAVLYTHTTEWYKYAFTHVHDDQLYWSTWSALCKVAQLSTIPSPSVIRPGLLADNYLSLHDIFPDIERRWRRWSRHEKRRLRNEYSRW